MTDEMLEQWEKEAQHNFNLTPDSINAEPMRIISLISSLREARAEIKNKDEIFFKLQDLQTRTNNQLGEVLFENLTRANELRAARAQIKTFQDLYGVKPSMCGSLGAQEPTEETK